MNVLNQLIDSAQRWAMYQGDCVETLRGIPDNSIHYSIFSPPFASLYTYSNSDRDMGNSSDGAEFVQHFGYLVAELYRVIMPGRLVSIHCMNLPAMKSRDGFIGMGTGLDMGIAPQQELPAHLVFIGTLLEREETLLKDWRHNTKFPDTAKFKPKASLPNGDARYQAPRQAPYTPNAPPAAMPAANDSSAMAAQAMGVNHHHYPH